MLFLFLYSEGRINPLILIIFFQDRRFEPFVVEEPQSNTNNTAFIYPVQIFPNCKGKIKTSDFSRKLLPNHFPIT